MRYVNYIWDFDGTLADSYPHTASAFCDVMAQDGVTVDRDEAEQLLRTSLFLAYERYGLTQEQVDRFLAYEKTEQCQPPIRLYPHALDVLRTLHGRGARHFLATHRDEAAKWYLQKLGAAPYFTDVVTRQAGFPYKPDPACVLYLIEKHGLDPRHTLMVGDRELDVACGRRAGIDGCLVVENEAPTDTCAVFCIRDLRELLDV